MSSSAFYSEAKVRKNTFIRTYVLQCCCNSKHREKPLKLTSKQKPSAMSHLSFVFSTFIGAAAAFAVVLFKRSYSSSVLPWLCIERSGTFTESNLKPAMSNGWRLSYFDATVFSFFLLLVLTLCHCLNPEHLLRILFYFSHLPNWKLSEAYFQYATIFLFHILSLSPSLSLCLFQCIPFSTNSKYFCASDKNRFSLFETIHLCRIACTIRLVFCFSSILQWFSISVFAWFIAFSAHITSSCIKFTSSYRDTGTKTRHCTGSKSSIRQVSAISIKSNHIFNSIIFRKLGFPIAFIYVSMTKIEWENQTIEICIARNQITWR